jgi:two-component system, OmpR family, response regulator
MKSLKRILLVEDEPDIQHVVRMALESIGGFKVDICDSGRDAVNKAPALDPDLILLDVMMPGMDGPSTLRALRDGGKLPATPVIFLTGKSRAQDIAELKKLGAMDVISKPFDPMTLASTISKIWSSQNG